MASYFDPESSWVNIRDKYNATGGSADRSVLSARLGYKIIKSGDFEVSFEWFLNPRSGKNRTLIFFDFDKAFDFELMVYRNSFWNRIAFLSINRRMRTGVAELDSGFLINSSNIELVKNMGHAIESVFASCNGPEFSIWTTQEPQSNYFYMQIKNSLMKDELQLESYIEAGRKFRDEIVKQLNMSLKQKD